MSKEESGAGDMVTIPKSTIKLAAVFIAGFFIGGVAFSFIDVGIAGGNVQPQTGDESGDPPQRVDVSLDDDPMLGDPDAPVTIIEFSDYQCPYCARFFQQTLPQLKSEYIDTGEVKFVYRDMPLEQLGHNSAEEAAQAAECAGDQDSYWEMHDKLFEGQQGEWGYTLNEQGRATGVPSTEEARDYFITYADELGLDTEQFTQCIDTGKYADEVNADVSDGQAAGVGGTPTFFVGNEEDGFVTIVGAETFSTFQQVIEQELNN